MMATKTKELLVSHKTFPETATPRIIPQNVFDLALLNTETLLSHDTILNKSRDANCSCYVVMI